MEEGESMTGSDESIDQVASDWVAKQDRGLSNEEQREFDAWIAQDSKHAERFERHCRTWIQVGLAGRLEREMQSLKASKRVFPPVRILGIAASIAALVALTLVLVDYGPSQSSMLSNELVAEEYERHVLEDGSIVELNQGARAMLAYTREERRVTLVAGEAHFTVAKNPERPFIVTAGHTAVRAVGTAFSVQLKTATVEVLVTEGRIRMEKAVVASNSTKASSEPLLPEKSELVVGQRIEVSLLERSASPRVETVDEIEREKILAWKHPMIDFVSQPLSEVLAEFNRRNVLQLTVKDEKLQSLPITATLHTGRPEEFVSILELTENIEVQRTASQRIVLRPKKL